MRNHASLFAGVIGGLVVLAAVGCGKKGAPLPPLDVVPAAAQDFKVRRLGSTVFVQFRIPAANRDGTRPADVARVDVYGYTGTPVSLADFVENGTLVARCLVRRPPEPEAKGTKGTKDKGPGGAPPPRLPPPADGEAGFDQGSVVTVTEEMTPGLLAPTVSGKRSRRAPAKVPEAEAEAPLWTDPAAVPVRLYLVVGFNHRGRPGQPTTRGVVPLVTGAAPPSGVEAVYDQESTTLSWQAASNRRQPVQDDTLSTNLSSTPLGMTWCSPIQDPVAGQNLASRPLARGCEPLQAADPVQTLASTPKLLVSVPTRYNVYVAKPASPAAVAPPGGVGAFEMPTPLNEKPLEVLSFSQPRGEYDVERCFTVRSVDTFGGAEVESPPASPVCLTPKDIFPPAAPQGLGAVAGGGAVNLIWEPNTEPDLAGYLVLRGEAPGAELRPITPKPITETTYRDETVKPGVRYVYAVVAVDKADPPNASGRSNTVEETAR